MAESEKNIPPPSTEVVAPKALSAIMQAFHVDSEEAASSLIIEASKAIYGEKEKDYSFIGPEDRKLSEAELKGVSSLMRGISPKDSLESLLGAQIVASHLLGMKKLASNYCEDQKIGLRLLKFCNESMQLLEKKRTGSTQNITVNHNYNGPGQTLSQTVIKEK